jgi:hypothetical protein
MHVGERDGEWLTPMQVQSELFQQNGVQVRFVVEPDQGHGIQTLADDGSRRLFDQFEQAARGCK